MFEDNFPWPTPEEMNERGMQYQPFLHQYPQGISMLTALYKAANLQFLNRDFIEFEILPVADQCAATFINSMNPHFEMVGATKVTNGEDPKEFWKVLSMQLGDIFRETLTMKGLMRTSRHFYQHKWYTSGAEMEPEVMQNMVYGASPLTTVMFCQTPAVWVKNREEHEFTLLWPARI